MIPVGGFLETIMSFLKFLVPESFLGLEGNTIIYFIIFIIFVYLIYRFLKVAFKSALIFVAAALFPFVANYFLGINIPITVDSIISYGVTGVFLYFLGLSLKFISGIVKAITWPFRKLFGKSEEERLEEQIDEEFEERREEES